MRASDLGEFESADCDTNYASPTLDSLLSSGAFGASPSKSLEIQSTIPPKASPVSEHQGILTNRTNIFGNPVGSPRARGNENVPSGMCTVDGDHYEHIFGKLPDPIRLHEQTGEFDGQVVFIAHPNRDVSAHQWSSTSFQWVNIGRYAHFRRKVEGSLASDRLKGHVASHSPLEFFKLAAEHREKLIMEDGRPKEAPIEVHLSTPADILRMESLSTASSLASQGFPVLVRESDPPGVLFLEGIKPKTPVALHATMKREYLDDPFVAPLRSSSSKITSSYQPKIDKADSKGSLDFEYEFPFKSTTSAVPGLNCPTGSTSRELYLKEEKNCHEALCGQTIFADRMSQPALRDIDFGEEAASGLAISARHGCLSQKTAIPFSPEAIHDYWKLRNKLAKLGDQATRLSVPAQGRIAIPNNAYLQPTARSLFPSPGLTVANPHRVDANLDASAPPYANMRGLAPVSVTSGSGATTVNATATALRFSDPDGLRHIQEYEIANGLGQQAPTTQNFKGAFFTDSKPTTSDPTISLTVHVNEEEKLLNWFRDGHRPARQQEYAKSLISTAVKNRTFGTIGEVFDARKERDYEYTPPFVRLYEGLSEYIEEYHHGRRRSYFTQAWKAAPPQLRDSSPDGNKSYFHKSIAIPYISQAHSGFMNSGAAGPALGVIRSLSVPARARFSHESPIGDGKCGVN